MSLKGLSPEIERMLNDKDLDGLFKKVELDGYNNQKIRNEAIKALGLLKDPSAIEPLIRRLQKGRTLSVNLKWAILEFGEEAISPLIDLLSDENKVVRLKVAEILGGTRNIKAVEPLIQMLQDNDWLVRKEAVKSLGIIGDKRAIDALIPMLEDLFESIREEADMWLSRLGWQPEGSPPIPDIKALLANSDVEGLIEATAYKKDVKILAAAVDALGELRDPRAIVPLISLLGGDWNIHEYLGPHEKMVNALAKIGSPAVDPLITTLRDAKRSSDPYLDEDKNLRAGTARALGKIGDPKAIDELIPALWDKIPFVRLSAADALGAIGDPAVPRLIDIIDSYGSTAPRATARALKIVAGQDFKDNAAAWKRWWKEYRQSKGT